MMKGRYLRVRLGLVFAALLVGLTGAVTPAFCMAAEDGLDAAERQKIAAQIEELARSYFLMMGRYDFQGLRGMSTPEFEIIERTPKIAMRMGLDEFDERLRGLQQDGVEILFTPADFSTRVTRDAAWTMYVERGAGPYEGWRFYGTMTFKRDGDRWLLDMMTSIPVPEGSPDFPE